MWNDIEFILNIINDCSSKTDVLKRLELKISGGNYNTLSSFIKKNNINIEHFNDLLKTSNYIKYDKLEDVLIENSPYTSTYSLKRRLYKEGLKDRKCEKCGQDENWLGKKIALILDHINGDRHDNRLSNLQIVCPNCNAALETHCRGLNVKKEMYNHCDCGNKKRIDSKRCFNCYCLPKVKEQLKKDKIYSTDRKELRKVQRPSYQQLLQEIKEIGYAATGRKYLVSDNAIRKWIKMYEKYGENY